MNVWLMELNRKTALELAQGYFGTSETLKFLGGGITGYVFKSPDSQPFTTAAKIHAAQDSFDQELIVYRRLRTLGINQILGITVPKLMDERADVKLLKMDFVSPPYLLDFAGASLKKPDYSEDVMQDWHRRIAERFGPNSDIVYDVYHALSLHGIYYMDFHKGNLNLETFPGLKAWDQSDEADPY